LKRSVLAFLFVLSLLCVSQNLQALDKRTSQVYGLCAHCHGQNLEGDQKLAAPAIAGLPAWYVEAQLIKFRTGVRGKHPRDIAGMRMRPMAKTLKLDEDIKNIAAHIETMPAKKPTSTLDGVAANGQGTYAVCMGCHADKAQGIKEVSAPTLQIQNDWYLFQQLKNFKGHVRAADAAADPVGSQMSSIAATLVDEQAMKDVIAYIQTLN